MSLPLTLEVELHIQKERKGQVRLAAGPGPSPLPQGRLPRVSKLLALAHRFQSLLDAGEAADYADLARRGRVTRARLTQIMNLLLLAPDVQEEILFLPRVTVGRDPIQLRHLQTIALTPGWHEQRQRWQRFSGLEPLAREE